MYNKLILILILFSQNFPSQTIYEGNDFNYKQLLKLNEDSTFEYKSLEQGCMDPEPFFVEMIGKYVKNDNLVSLTPEFIASSHVQIHSDTLNINDELLNSKKKLIKKEKYKSDQKYKLNFVVLNYKNYQFLMEIDDSEYKEAKDYFLELSDHLNQENSRAEQYITTKLHFIGDFSYSRSELKKMLPEQFKRYFIDKIIEFKITKYTEKIFRDPSVIPEVPDSEAMLYDYKIELNKGSDDGVFPEMKIYPQKDLSNCNYDFQFIKVDKNTSYGVLSTGSKCKLKNNYFSTVFRLQKL